MPPVFNVIPGIKGFQPIHGMKHKRLYRIWKLMRSRCNNPNTKQFKDWGGRGIKVCPEWNDFSSYYLHILSLLPPGSDDLPAGFSVDRRDNDGDYEPGNIRIASRTEQNRNRRSVRQITINGVTQLLCDWCRQTGISDSLAHGRVKRLGWSWERAVTTPANPVGVWHTKAVSPRTGSG